MDLERTSYVAEIQPNTQNNVAMARNTATFKSMRDMKPSHIAKKHILRFRHSKLDPQLTRRINELAFIFIGGVIRGDPHNNPAF